jgi:hypothetical protein
VEQFKQNKSTATNFNETAANIYNGCLSNSHTVREDALFEKFKQLFKIASRSTGGGDRSRRYY